MYHLGLLFYELFTGGEIPPSNLFSLALYESAFVSLSTLTLVNEKTSSRTTSSGANKRHQGPSSPDEEIGLCELSCEYMELIGIKSPICRLIFNMLNSVHGDFSGNESYTNMIDVASDLKLMIDRPSKFLQRLDVDKLSMSGLPMNEIEIPREAEFEAIKSCFNRCISESCEIGIIEGGSGTGKSSLAYSVGSYVISEGSLFLTGKFDQMQQPKPFSALASALDQYCDLLLRLKEKDTGRFKSIVDSFNTALGSDACHLFNVIPRLETILGEDRRSINSAVDDNYSNVLQRLHYLMSQFVNVMSTTSVASVVLFMDDIQWIDDASLSMLQTILRQKPKKFFFLGCCRNDMSSDHSFWKMVLDIGDVGVRATRVELNCMREETLNRIVSDLLCLSPRLVRSLSSILFSRTKGNALFFMQLLLLLHRDGLLYLDFGRSRWAWNESKIISMKLPDNIAICLMDGIGKLPIEVQLALNTLSMFGASARVPYLELLESQLKIKILEPLKEASGLVTNLNGSLHFCHDRIQETSLNLIEEHDRRGNHLSFGKCLITTALDANDNGMLFTAVDQINLAGPSAISDYEDYFNMASYNLAAGLRAMNMAEFGSALADYYWFRLKGLSPLAPLTFACFGSYLAKLGDLLAGHKFALLAKSLLSKHETCESKGEVLQIVS